MHGRGIFNSSRIWTVFSSMMRAPPSHASAMFCTSCPCGPAAGPSGVDARCPWNSTERSRSGKPRKNLLFGKSKILPSLRYSWNARRNSSGSGSGTSSAIGLLQCSHIGQREGRVELGRLHQVADRYALHHRVRHVFFARPEPNGGHAHQAHGTHAVGAERPLVHHRLRSEEHTSELQSPMY